ncbi:MAG TPA: DEAD/DEAH box helicase, partial [Thermoprotei archaeon]|nr:DEAD/DEAH box helicase [Thermoprotei archaeon]
YMPINSEEILLKYGYDFYKFIDKPVKPEYSNILFKDIVPKLTEGDGWIKKIAYKKLYKHQYDAYIYLSKGYNIVLKSGTGSGKTEAWLLYTFKENISSLAVYPTLALANDQINRIKSYCNVLGLKVEQIDAKTKEILWRNGFKTSDIRRKLGSANIVITNPAFLMMDLKRWAINPRKSVLREFFKNVGLIVFDEFDFYGPREIALLLAMISILNEICGKNFQIAVMTATLGNPKDLAKFLSKVNSRESIIIEGKPFKVKNVSYIVLGKNLRNIWSYIRRFKDIFLREKVGEDVRKALEDYEIFRENVFKILEIAKSFGIEVPRIEFDIAELLQQYVYDEGLTIVFTGSIAVAEQFSRRIRTTLDVSLKDRVASHHHLISKSLREKIEEGARDGYVKIIFSPRTLSQGIDIGRVVRIVHLGLPEDVREFYQREGRKGRREEISFTESIIIPFSKWDRELLSRGLNEFISWIKLPLEQVIVNEDNKYIMLFKSLFHFISSRHGGFKISDEEYQFLKNFGMIEGLDLSRRGKRTWLNLNFYEYSPPYGIKRIRISNEGEKYLEDISHCDLVEKFQIGCFDYSSDSIVTGHRLGGKTGRIVVGIEEKPISYGLIWKHEALSEAYGEYEKIKSKWGEKPALISDYNMGRIYSEVLCTVKPPTSGFGLLYKFPSRVVWYVVSSRSRVIKADNRTIAIRERRPIEIPTPTYG